MELFKSTDILLPMGSNMVAWSVIACDQFTSQPEYWDEVSNNVTGNPSTLNLIFPEVFLNKEQSDADARICSINESMKKYLQSELFTTYTNSYIYVERTLLNGKIRKGLVGVIDLEAYSFETNSNAAIRSTEKTVSERIPPRVRIRQNAPLELSHAIVLLDDAEKQCIEFIENNKANLPVLYEFDLMCNGGHVVGRLVQGTFAEQFERKLIQYYSTVAKKYQGTCLEPIYFAIGDGNHSLAAAKTCYEKLKRMNASMDALNIARYAMVEIENLHDDAQQFEPIHRIVQNVDVQDILCKMSQQLCCGVTEGCSVKWYSRNQSGEMKLDQTSGGIAVEILQNFFDEYLKNHEGQIDYIHGDEALIKLSKNDRTIGFKLPPIEKNDFFMQIAKNGVYPRKTFSMGHATEKRYYIESRCIK